LRKLGLTLFFLMAMAPLISPVLAVVDYTPKSLSLKVFADGVTGVEYRVSVNPTLARVNVTGVGYQIHNLAVKDQDGEILGSSLVDGLIVVNALGTRTVVIGYTTPGLTLKDGPVWALDVELPVESNILLPASATILSMRPMPLGIGIVGGVTTLTMPPGNVSIGYIIGVVGTKEHALAVINDAEETISEAVGMEVKVGDASSLLEGAWEAYLAENYIQAEELARDAKSEAEKILGSAIQASSAIDQADSAGQAAVKAGRTSGLTDVEVNLEQARALYTLGDYDGAAVLAGEALVSAEDSRRPFNSGFFLWAIPLGGVVVLLFLYLRKREERPQEDVPEVDLDAVFEAYPQLRMDEREALRFITSAGEGVFVSEIREQFSLPRSSAWRMVRRLEEMGVIEEERIGRETFLRLKVNQAE